MIYYINTYILLYNILLYYILLCVYSIREVELLVALEGVVKRCQELESYTTTTTNSMIMNTTSSNSNKTSFRTGSGLNIHSSPDSINSSVYGGYNRRNNNRNVYNSNNVHK